MASFAGAFADASVEYSSSKASEFRPTRAVVLSEMSTKEKEKYYTLLLENGARFYLDQGQSDEIYIANIRVLAPGVKKEKKKGFSKDGKAVTDVRTCTPPAQRLNRLAEAGGTMKVTISGVKPFDYAPYIRFVALISHENEVVKPKARILSWLMKLIEELYDARFAHEKSDVERDAELSQKFSSSLEGKLQQQVLPVFIYRQLSTVLGLPRVVEQSCWDLVFNTDRLRLDYLEVEVFARFLQEFYDQDDLLFFLYVRSVIANVLHINFRGRWSRLDGPGRQTPQALWMSHRECVQVARVVFGAGNDTLCKEFLALITPQMVGQKTDQGDSRRIDITQFLHLAVVGYHQTQGSNSGGGAGTLGVGDTPGGGGRSSSPKRFSNYQGPGGGGSVAGSSSVDAYLQLMAGGGDGSGSAAAGRNSLLSLANTPIAYGRDAGPDTASLLDMSIAGGWNASGGSPGEGEEQDHFAQLATERESEFLHTLCEPLNQRIDAGTLNQQRAAEIIDRLASELKAKVSRSVVQSPSHCLPFFSPLKSTEFPLPPSLPHSLAPTPHTSNPLPLSPPLPTHRSTLPSPSPTAPTWMHTTSNSSTPCGPCWTRWRR